METHAHCIVIPFECELFLCVCSSRERRCPLISAGSSKLPSPSREICVLLDCVEGGCSLQAPFERGSEQFECFPLFLK